MPNLCTKCGAPVVGTFCMKCGQQVQAPNAPSPVQSQPAPVQSQPAPPAPVQSPPAAQTPPAKPKGSGCGKFLLIAGCILLLLVVLAVAGIFYGVHWAKNKITAVTGGMTGNSQSQVKVEQGTSCTLLSREELQQVLGVTIEKSSEIMEGSDPGCAYYTNPEAFAQLQKMAVEQARKQSEEASKHPAPKTDNPLELLKDPNQMEGMVKSLGLTQPDKDGKVFSFTVQRNAGSSDWSATRAATSAIPGFEDVPDVGDHAMMGSFGHTFYVLKGDSMIQMNTTYVPDARTRGADIGRKIVSHL